MRLRPLPTHDTRGRLSDDLLETRPAVPYLGIHIRKLLGEMRKAEMLAESVQLSGGGRHGNRKNHAGQLGGMGYQIWAGAPLPGDSLDGTGPTRPRGAAKHAVMRFYACHNFCVGARVQITPACSSTFRIAKVHCSAN